MAKEVILAYNVQHANLTADIAGIQKYIYKKKSSLRKNLQILLTAFSQVHYTVLLKRRNESLSPTGNVILNLL